MQANIELEGQGGRHSVSSKASIEIIIRKKPSLFNLRNVFRHLSKIHALQVTMTIKFFTNAAATRDAHARIIKSTFVLKTKVAS